VWPLRVFPHGLSLILSEDKLTVSFEPTVYQAKTGASSRPARPLRIIHTGDVHLESDTFTTGKDPAEVRQKLRRAFSNVIDLAICERADLLLIAGDLFDSSRVSEEAIDFALAEIERASMRVVAIPGNHDPHDDTSVLAAMERRKLPPNLHLILSLEGQTLEFADLQTRIWARAMREHSADYRPLQGLSPARSGWWNIALAHGLFVEEDDGLRASPITPAEIAASGYDYVALGHVHVFRELSQGSTCAAYCGAPVPAHSGAGEGTVALVVCSPDSGATVRAVRLAAP